MNAMTEKKKILCFGFSYCAAALVPYLKKPDWDVMATARDAARAKQLTDLGIEVLPIDTMPPNGTPIALDQIADVTHILVSPPPDETGMDPAYQLLSLALAQHRPSWIGYLSTTGVYGDHGGAWIDEDTPIGPLGERGLRRVKAEQNWRSLGEAYGHCVNFFRLAGIYGPSRNGLVTLQQGRSRRILKPGQVFSRIHVEDIAQILLAAIENPNPGRAYSVCDDEPSSPEKVVRFAAALMGVEPPPLVPFEEADLSPMAKSFYGENKRIRNDRIKTELGVDLKFPTYRDGLTSLWRAMQSASSD